MSNINRLFEPGKIGDVEVSNRIFMAPLTRNRAHFDGTPAGIASIYYGQRATAGLVISEATQIEPLGKGYLDTPGIYNDEQEAAWKETADAVHLQGGKIFMQLWHVGRISHSSLLPDRQAPVAPSAIQAKSKTFTANGFEDVSCPRALLTEEVEGLVKSYGDAAVRAIKAGMDGVEIHAANGYLINQFISTNSNQRLDKYGGNVENRARFLLEIVDEVTKAIGAGRTGVRLSPAGTFNDISDADAQVSYKYIFSEIERRNLAYLHVLESFPGIDSDSESKDFIAKLRDNFRGNYIANGNYNAELAAGAVTGSVFGVAFGRNFISNPDLVKRIKNGLALTPPDQTTFYGGTEKGYTDYPFS